MSASIVEQGWLQDAQRLPSPNFDAREADAVPEVIIIHCISLPPGVYGGAQVSEFFTNCLDCSAHPYFEEIENLQVSSHFYIQRNGELTQFVSTEQRAWHAGESSCLGRPKVNNFSIGIELEGLDTDPTGFTAKQYTCLARLITDLRRIYPKIEPTNIFAHSDIAPGRKPDPGPFFDWDKLFNEL